MPLEEDLISESLLNLDFDEFIKTIKIKHVGKNLKYSAKIRERGNKLYIRKGHDAELHKEILNFYSMSVAFAPEASEELALAYGNRSALLLHLKKFKESLEDLNKSLNITVSDSLKVKLYCRKVQCLAFLGLNNSEIAFKEAVKYFNKIENNKEKESLGVKINKTKYILQNHKLETIIAKHDKRKLVLENLLEKEKNIFYNIDIKYSEKYGRHLVTTKEFKPGEIIYVEKPYAICSNNKISYIYIYCCHCLAVAWAGIPCKYCSWCIFCSVECREEAWKTYHKIECSIYPFIKCLSKNFVQLFRLSIRIIMMGINEFETIDKFKSEIKYIDNCTDVHRRGFSNDGKFVNSKFRSVYSLFNNISKEQLKANTYNVVVSLTCMIKYTSFFNLTLSKNEELKNLVKNTEVIFFGVLLLRLINITYVNRYRISNSMRACKHFKQPFKCLIAECCTKGVCLAPISSLINNSCIPNIKKCFTEDNKIIIYAVEPIEKNSQIFDSYLCNFYDAPITYRNNLLKEYFHITCNCVACERNWPAFLNSIEPEKQFIKTDNFLENKFIQENKETLSLIHAKDAKFDKNILQNLIKVIQKATKIFSQPCSIRCILIFSLQKIFEKMYGSNVELFNHCQKHI